MRAGSTRREWTFEEILVMRRHYRLSNMGQRFAAVCRLLPDRSKGAVRQKALLLRRAGML